MIKSAHLDTFAEDHLPPESEWPQMDYSVLPELNYPQQLNCATELLDKMAAGGAADQPLFNTSEMVWSYGDFLSKANQIANFLQKKWNLVPGNRVLLHGPNSPMLAACWFAVVKAGGICVTTMPLLRSKELSYIVAKAEVDFCLCDSRTREEIDRSRSETSWIKNIAYFNGHSQPESEQNLDSQISRLPLAFDNVPTAATDCALIAFTSGTTGTPKATMHFHRDVMAICDTFPRHILKPDSSDIFTGTPPFAFTFGLGALLLFPMRYGASIALVEKSGPTALLETIQAHRATISFTSPTGYRAMLDHIPNFDISSLRKSVSAGETLPPPTFESWHAKTGIKMIDGIGATELLHIFISASDDDIRIGATGKPVPGFQAKIIDQQGDEVPPGNVGLLAVRGPTGCRYLGDDRQKNYVKDGWNITGDAYLMDQEGYFWFQARADDMIISSGYNISGVEVENTLLSHPQVKECGVIAVPDQDRGNLVKAVIVLHESSQANEKLAQELKNFVKSQIAPYKYPRIIEFVDKLPRTETGKLQRFRLREIHQGNDR